MWDTRVRSLKSWSSLNRKPYCFIVCGCQRSPQTQAAIWRNIGDLGRFQGRGRKGKYPGQIPPGWKCNNYTNLGMTWMNGLWSFGINRSIVILSDHTEVLMFFRPPRIFLALYLCVCVCESHSRNIPTSFRVIDCWKICACYHSIFF